MLRRSFFPLLAAAPAAFQPPRLEPIPAEPPAPAGPGSGPLAGRRWKLQYLHDDDKWTALLADFLAPSPGRAVAALRLESDGRERSVMLVARDGGASWKEVPFADKPLSLFSIGESHIWAVAEKSLWISAESGYAWRRTPLPKTPRRYRPFRVHFVDPLRGWAFGPGRKFHATSDGGATWSLAAGTESLQLKDENTVWTSMSFLNSREGLIAGFSDPRLNEEPRIPDWMLPERAARRRLAPITTIAGETRDGGASWKFSVTSAFGRAVRLRANEGGGLAVYHYSENFPFSSEVYTLDFTSGASRPVFRRRDLWVHDALLLEDGGLLLAAIQTGAELRASPVPGKLRVLYSPDRKSWSQMAVDYRAEGHRAFLASPAPGEIWAATDAGCVLRLA